MFGGLRIGLYEPVKKLIVGKDHVGDVGLGHKIVAGLFTGARAAAATGARAWYCAGKSGA
jgi:solute carrier family 25 uncoupling protein 8/9